MYLNNRSITTMIAVFPAYGGRPSTKSRATSSHTCDGTDKGCSRLPENGRRFCSSGRHTIPPHAGEHPFSWLPSRTTKRASLSLKNAKVTSRFGIVELMQQSRSRWGRRNNYSAFKEQKPFKF